MELKMQMKLGMKLPTGDVEVPLMPEPETADFWFFKLLNNIKSTFPYKYNFELGQLALSRLLDHVYEIAHDTDNAEFPTDAFMSKFSNENVARSNSDQFIIEDVAKHVKRVEAAKRFMNAFQINSDKIWIKIDFTEQE